MSELNAFEKFVSYLPLLIIFLGITGNTVCFVVFRFFEPFKKIPAMVFLSFVAIADTASLFVWNLNHFLKPNFKIELEYLDRFSCKFFPFLQLFSLQLSSNLLSIMCIDRFITIISTPGSIYSRLPFSTLKTAYIWSGLITVILFFLNFHFLLFNGNYWPIKSQYNITITTFINGTYLNQTQSEVVYDKCFWYTSEFRIYPLWDKINLAVYNFFPFAVMTIFNFLLITKTLMQNKSLKTMKNKNEIKAFLKKRRLTISILSITFAFIIMTMPGTISFGFFFDYFLSIPNGVAIINLIDFFAFLFHSSLFFNCFFTNVKFRKFVFERLLCLKSKKIQSNTNNTQTSEFSVKN